MALLFPLAALGESVEGVYANGKGNTVFKLQNGKYVLAEKDGTYMTVGGKNGMPVMEMGFPYRVEGTLLIVQQVHGEAKLEILPDGKLKIDFGGEQIFHRK